MGIYDPRARQGHASCRQLEVWDVWNRSRGGRFKEESMVAIDGKREKIREKRREGEERDGGRG